MTQLTAISLFTGAGGLDYGFEAAGFRTAVALEIDRRCVETLNQNRDWPVMARDLAEGPTARLLRAARVGSCEADALIWGPPCEAFSKSGFCASRTGPRLD